jgi:transcriptional regulator with XRE-family HTH domain
MKKITGPMIKAARILLDMKAEDLAAKSSLGLATIRRAEAERGEPALTAANLRAITTALEEAGIEFLNSGSPGVRIRKR